jgi:exodeoxyribonuclease V beta subunit
MNPKITNFDPQNTELLTGINLIEASAGTGKTYAIAMLVLRFVVEENFDIKQILVVTFTRAATEELKDRIRSRLVDARLVAMDSEQGDEGLQQWMEQLEIEPREILQRLNTALLDIDQAGIFTIHSFCQRTLAEHALESGQLFDTELTGDVSTIKQACSDDFWRKNVYQRIAWEASLLTAQYQAPDDLFASVQFIGSELTVLPAYKDLDQQLVELKNIYDQNKESILLILPRIASALGDKKFKPAFEKEFNANKQPIIDWLKGDNLIAPSFLLLTSAGLIDGLNGNKFRKSIKNPLPPDEQKQAYLDELDVNLIPCDELSLAINQLSLVFRRSLLETLREEVKKRLEQLNVLSFDDLIIRLADALESKQGEVLRQEIQQHYQVALIDEFQDTDKSQWTIFSSLFDSPDHRLYLIGDPKQAIYKFRGADIASYFLAKQRATYHFSLGANWRSHPQLVEGVNILFDGDASFLSDKLMFNPVESARTVDDGLLIQKGDAVSPLVLWQLDETPDKKYWKKSEAEEDIKIAVVNEILDLLSPKFSLKNKAGEKPVQQRDIAILVKSNAQAEAFQALLNQAEVTAVINSKTSVFSSIEAQDLYFLLQAIAQPNNSQLVKQALTLSWFGYRGQALLALINDEVEMDNWLFSFINYQHLWKTEGLMPMILKLLSEKEIFPRLSKLKQAERCLTNLQHCIELVQEAAIDEHLGVNKTLDWLHKQIVSAKSQGAMPPDEQQLRLESDDDAVKIMTMHSAKGLEYPIVFCPFLWQRGAQLALEKRVITCHKESEMIVDLGSEQFEEHRGIALEEELAEDLRLFYVAVTRAKYRCYIHWADVRTKTKPNQSAMAYLFDFNGDDFSQQQDKLRGYQVQHAKSFEYRLLAIDGEVIGTLQAPVIHDELFCETRLRSLYTYWQMSSYTALSSLSIHDTPELPDDKAREGMLERLRAEDDVELPRGAHTGNVIHDLLETIPFHYLAKNNDISEQRDQACLRYGLKTDHPEQINLLLQNTVNTEIEVDGSRLSLKNLQESQCLKEMPFYLSIQTMDVSRINQILKDSPTFQPLSHKILCGYLTGFIDLICEYKGRYYVMDYKSNSLDTYDQSSLITSMREHNYGLQYWIYTLVLHQYLQNRLPDYDYDQHIGGVMYLFVRGMDKNVVNSGVYQVRPELEKIEQLAELFIRG